MQRNIPILYSLAFLSNSLFWLGIWALYYLLFTSSAGIGVVETTVVTSAVLFEIPTGALADLIGKKKSLVVGYFLKALGSIIMALALNLNYLLVSVVVLASGTAMISGTFESITYDTLKKLGRENDYDKVFSRQNSIALVTNATAVVIGGLLYTYVSKRAPYFMVGAFFVFASVASAFLVEPHVSSERFSLKKYKEQLGQGFQQLFQNKQIRSLVTLFVLVGTVPIFMYQLMTDLLFIAYGATATQMSIAIFIVYVVAATVAHFTATIHRKFGLLKSFIWVAFLYGILLLLAPFIGFYVSVILLSLLAGMFTIMEVLRSQMLNREIDSDSRATSLSTFTLILKAPYMMSAILLGYFSDLYGVTAVVFGLGIMMLIFVFLGFIATRRIWRLDKP